MKTFLKRYFAEVNSSPAFSAIIGLTSMLFFIILSVASFMQHLYGMLIFTSVFSLITLWLFISDLKGYKKKYNNLD